MFTRTCVFPWLGLSSPMVAPSKMVRTKIFATSVNDQRNPVSASPSSGGRWCFSMVFFPCNSPVPYFFRNKTSHVPCILNISAISCGKRKWTSWTYFVSCQGLETLGKHGNPPAVEGQKKITFYIIIHWSTKVWCIAEIAPARTASSLYTIA